MGNQLAVSGSAAAVNLSDISDNARHLQLVAPLGGVKRGRLFTSLHCRQLHSSSDVVIKVFVQRPDDRAQAAAINTFQDALQMVEAQMRRYFKEAPEAPCNLLFYTLRSRHGGYCLLQRPYIHYSVAERLQMRPFWEPQQRLFACYQLLQALVQLHEGCKCTHGDLKPENVLLSTQDWLYIADFCPYKPPLLPTNNPANFEFFYDNSETRYCCCGPEKFTDKGGAPSAASAAAAGLSSAADASAASFSEAVGASSSPAIGGGSSSAPPAAAGSASTGGSPPSPLPPLDGVPEGGYPPYHSALANSLHFNNSATSTCSFGGLGGARGGAMGSVMMGNGSVIGGGGAAGAEHHLASADVFAAACVIVFILTDEPLFKLSGALEFNAMAPSQRRAFLLAELTTRRVTDEGIRTMLCHMLCCDPKERPSASHLLRRYTPTVFPHSFALIHGNVAPALQQMPPDAQIHHLYGRHTDLLRALDACEALGGTSSNNSSAAASPNTAKEKGKADGGMSSADTKAEADRRRFVEAMGMSADAFRLHKEREERSAGLVAPSSAGVSPSVTPVDEYASAGPSPSAPATAAKSLTSPTEGDGEEDGGAPISPIGRGRAITLLLPYLATALRFARSPDARCRALVILRRWLPWASEAARRDVVLPWARQVLQSRRAGLQARCNAVRTLREVLASLPTLPTNEAFLFEDYVLDALETVLREPGVLAPQAANSGGIGMGMGMGSGSSGSPLLSADGSVAMLQPMLSLLAEMAASLPPMLLVGCSYVRQRQKVYALIAQNAANRRREGREAAARAAAADDGSDGSDEDDDDAYASGGAGGGNGAASAYASFDNELREVVDRGWELMKLLLSANQSAVAVAALQQLPALCAVLGQERVTSELLPILTTFLSAPAVEVKAEFLRQIPFLGSFLSGTVGVGGIGSLGANAPASFLAMVLDDGLRQADVGCVCAALEALRIVAQTKVIPTETVMPTVSTALRHLHSPNAWAQEAACLLVEEVAKRYAPSDLLLHVARPMLSRLRRPVPLVALSQHKAALKPYWQVAGDNTSFSSEKVPDPFSASYASYNACGDPLRLLSGALGGGGPRSRAPSAFVSTYAHQQQQQSPAALHAMIVSRPMPPCADYLAAVFDPSRVLLTGRDAVRADAPSEAPITTSHADVYGPTIAAATAAAAAAAGSGSSSGSSIVKKGGSSGLRSNTIAKSSYSIGSSTSPSMGPSGGSVTASAAIASASFAGASSPSGSGGNGGASSLVSSGVSAAALVQRLITTYEAFTVEVEPRGDEEANPTAQHQQQKAWRMETLRPTERQRKRIEARAAALSVNGANGFGSISGGDGGPLTSPTGHAASPYTAAPSSLGGRATRSSAAHSVFGGGGGGGVGTINGLSSSAASAASHKSLFGQWDQQNPNAPHSPVISVHGGYGSGNSGVLGPGAAAAVAASAHGNGTRASIAASVFSSHAGGGSDRAFTRSSVAASAISAHSSPNSTVLPNGASSASSSAVSGSASAVAAAAASLRPMAAPLAAFYGPAWDTMADSILCMSAGGPWLVTGGGRGTVALWDCEAMARTRRCAPQYYRGLVPSSATVLFAQFTYNMNSPIVVGATDGAVRLFDPQTEALYATHRYGSGSGNGGGDDGNGGSSNGSVRACARLTPNVTLVGADDGSLVAIDWRTRSPSVWSSRLAMGEGGASSLLSLNHHTASGAGGGGGGMGMGGSSLGAAVGDPAVGEAYGFVAGTSEGYVSLFDLRFGLCVKSFSAALPHGAGGCAPSPLPPRGGAPLQPPSRGVLSMCCDPRTTSRIDTAFGPSLVVSTADGGLQRFAVETGEPSLRFQTAQPTVTRALLHVPRSPLVISASDDGLVRLWDFLTPSASATMACPPQRSGAYEFVSSDSVFIEREPSASSSASSSAAPHVNYGGSHPHGITTLTPHNTSTSAANAAVGIGACATARYGGNSGGGHTYGGGGGGGGGSAKSPLTPLHNDHITAMSAVTVRGTSYLVTGARDGTLRLWSNQPPKQ